LKAISYPFRIGLDGSVATESTQRGVWSSRLRLLLDTRAGERAHRPSYGVDFVDALFDDPSDAIETVVNEVSRAVGTHLPEIRLEEVSAEVSGPTVLVHVNYLTPDGSAGSLDASLPLSRLDDI
jgi:phage baseplate assembly protein W